MILSTNFRGSNLMDDTANSNENSTPVVDPVPPMEPVPTRSEPVTLPVSEPAIPEPVKSSESTASQFVTQPVSDEQVPTVPLSTATTISEPASWNETSKSDTLPTDTVASSFTTTTPVVSDIPLPPLEESSASTTFSNDVPPTPKKSHKKLYAGLVVLLLLIALPVALFLSQNQQDIRQRAQTYTCEQQCSSGGLTGSNYNACVDACRGHVSSSPANRILGNCRQDCTAAGAPTEICSRLTECSTGGGCQGNGQTCGGGSRCCGPYICSTAGRCADATLSSECGGLNQSPCESGTNGQCDNTSLIIVKDGADYRCVPVADYPNYIQWYEAR